MRIPGVKTAKLAARRLRSRQHGLGVILGYHRIGDSSWDPFGLCVSPGNFSEQVDVIRREARAVPLAQLVQESGEGGGPGKGLALTFDDGYLECQNEVEPVLERHGMQATVFVVTGQMGQEFWWDRLARLLAPPRELPREIRVSSRGVELGWSAQESSRVDARLHLVREAYRVLEPLGIEERGALLSEIERRLGASSEAESRPRSLSAGELKDLVARGRIRAGAHGHSHRGLGGLSSTDQRSEIETSRDALENALGREVRFFSYPHGSRSEETPSLVREAGFDLACGSTPSGVFAQSDPFDLPRIWVPDVAGPAFSKWLRSWLGKGGE